VIGLLKGNTSRVVRILVAITGLAVAGVSHRAMAFNIAIWPGEDASVWAPGLNLTNVVAISGGDGHAMVLRADGSVVSWYGYAGYEMGVANGVQIASGWCHDLAVKADGTVIEWGLVPPNCGSTAPGATSMPAGLSNIVAAAGGHTHSLVLRADGTCVSWGWMTVSAGYVPAGLSNVTAIAGGFDISAALQSDGTVVNWGYTGYGGTGGNGLTGISAIALGHSHGLALRTNGTVAVWGGTLGAPPVTLTNVVRIGAKQQWGCAAQADGTIIGWGAGGQVNCPTLPVTNILQLAPMNWAGMLLVGDGPPQPLWRLSNIVALAETTVKFTGEAVGTEPLAYQWYFNGTNLPGANTPTLTIANVQPELQGDYYVVVSNAFGVRSNAGGQLTMLASRITLQPTNQTVYGGDTATLAATVEGGSLQYQWQFFGTNLPGATNTVLNLTNVTVAHAGDYSLVVSNIYGVQQSSNAILTVIPIAISSQPASASRYVGDSVTFQVTAIKNGPFSYQWQLGGVDMPGRTGSTLTLSSLVLSNAGNYSVSITNPYGSTHSADATLAVTDSKPIITAQPASVGAYPGNTVTFQVTATGSKPLAYQWLSNGVPITGATATNLVLSSVTPASAALYSVLISNAVGTTLSSNAALAFLKVCTWGSTNSFGLGTLPFDLTNVVAVAVGNNHSVALKSDGRVTAWGYNFWNQTSVPASATNVIAISAQVDYTLALKSNGTVVAWGNVGAVPANVSNVIAIAAGGSHQLALRSNGTLVSWGSGTVTNVPANATNIVAIAAGQSFSAALRADRTVLSWGSSAPSTNGMTNVVMISGGDFPLVALKAGGKIVASSTLPAPPANLSNVVAVAAGRYHALALKSDGTVTNWTFSSPFTPAGLSNVVSMATGPSHCLAILGSGPAPAPIPYANPRWSSNVFTLSLPAADYGRLYWLEYKDSVTAPTWKTLPLNRGNASSLTLTDSLATVPQRFYRIRKW
jgi:alpha-tubulin suppressor-like RCC1 family protein